MRARVAVNVLTAIRLAYVGGAKMPFELCEQMKRALGCWSNPAVIKDRKGPQGLNIELRSVLRYSAVRVRSNLTQMANPKAGYCSQGRRMGKADTLSTNETVWFPRVGRRRSFGSNNVYGG